jgi:hypothetical protein
MQEARATLNAAIKAGQPVDAAAAVVGNLFGQLTAIRAKAQEQFRAILTPEQLAKLDQFRAHEIAPRKLDEREGAAGDHDGALAVLDREPLSPDSRFDAHRQDGGHLQLCLRRHLTSA